MAIQFSTAVRNARLDAIETTRYLDDEEAAAVLLLAA